MKNSISMEEFVLLIESESWESVLYAALCMLRLLIIRSYVCWRWLDQKLSYAMSDWRLYSPTQHWAPILVPVNTQYDNTNKINITYLTSLKMFVVRASVKKASLCTHCACMWMPAEVAQLSFFDVSPQAIKNHQLRWNMATWLWVSVAAAAAAWGSERSRSA